MAAGDIRELDRRAVLASVAVVSAATAGDLGRATPCADWTLRQLLEHMIAQHDGFAAAAAGKGGGPHVWEVRSVVDPVAEYAAAADRVITAFAGPDVVERKFVLPEILPRFGFPAA